MSATLMMLTGHVVLIILLVVIVLVDRKEHKFSKTYIIVGAALWVAMALSQSFSSGSFEATLMPLLGRAAGGALVAGLIPFILARVLDRVAGDEVLGINDIMLLFMVGLFLDWKLSLIMLALTALIGFLAFKVFKKKDFAFAPAVTISTILVLIGYWVVTFL